MKEGNINPGFNALLAVQAGGGWPNGSRDVI